jgi:hypothetical protein
MSKLKLDQVIDAGCKDLRWIAEAVAHTKGSGTLCEKSYTFFESGASLAIQLEDAKGLIPLRDVALSAASQFPCRISPSRPDRFIYNDVEVAFKQGRFLVFQSYQATTWALYDAIAKVAGNLCCVDKRVNNAIKPINLPTDLLQSHEFVGARVSVHLKGAYGFPIGLSYAIRNWLMHDGHAQEGVELFEFEGLTTAPYQISPEAWSRIQKKVTEDYKVDASQTRLRPFPSIRSDLLLGLVGCHEEADEAMGFVLAWSIAAVRSQAEILLARDAAMMAMPAPDLTLLAGQSGKPLI